ncbi:MAG: GAF domain-containing protein, partial [Bacteroidales bacterium]
MNIKNNLKKLSFQFILFLLIVISGVIYIRYTWIKIKNEQSENVLQIARSIEACLPKDDIKTLDVLLADTNKPAYLHIKNILKEIIHVNTNARFAYLYTHKNAKLYFLADSEPENSKDYSPPGQEYTEAKADDKQPFIDGKELITVPLSDRWGKWVSAFIPIKDNDSGKIIAVFGLDFNARTWNNTLYYEIIQSSGLVVLLLMLLLFSLRIKAKNLSLKNENTERRQAEKALLESENQKAAILKAIPDLLFVFNYKGDYLDVYSEDDSKLFIPRQALIGKNISELFPPEVAKEAIEAFKKSLEFKELVQFSYSVQINTKLEYFEARIVPASDYEVLAIVRDITDRKNVEQEISYSQERARQQRNVLAEIALNEVISSGNLKPAFQKLTEEISAAIQVERASIWLFSDDRSALHCISLYESKTLQHSDGSILNCADYPLYFEAILHDSRINANDAINDSRTSEFAANYLLPLGISSMLDAGIYLEGALVGVVCLEHCGEKRNWFADEESFA